MSRYIDADALKANCDITIGDTTTGKRNYVMFHEIDSAPSIDIVPRKAVKGYEDGPHCGAKMKGARDYERAIEQMEYDALYEPTYNSEDGSM